MTVKILADRLSWANLVLPAPVRLFLANRPRPLAVGTSAELLPWTATHGYAPSRRGCCARSSRASSTARPIRRASSPASIARPSTATMPARLPSPTRTMPTRCCLAWSTRSGLAGRRPGTRLSGRPARLGPHRSRRSTSRAGRTRPPRSRPRRLRRLARPIAGALDDAIKVRASPSRQEARDRSGRLVEVAVRGPGRTRSRPRPASNSSRHHCRRFRRRFHRLGLQPEHSPTPIYNIGSLGRLVHEFALAWQAAADVIRAAVEQAQARRSSLQLIAAYAKNLNSPPWIASVEHGSATLASISLPMGMAPRRCFVAQTAEMVDEMLVGTVPARARRWMAPNSSRSGYAPMHSSGSAS